MKNMRLLTIGLAFLLAFLGINSCRKQPEQAYKKNSMKMTGTFMTVTESTFPSETQFTTDKRRAENVTIETGTLTCTADTALFNEESGQMRLTGNVVVRTADGIKITAEEVVFTSDSAVEDSNSLPR
ncbi:MAG: hypothetical protein H8D56_06920 [Planctomycetes bacterium]|nr:hypothetical protein [Planctomycetota bacterium]MBL7146883.1 hypothetical protein [Phycisphaerae bacterium]